MVGMEEWGRRRASAARGCCQGRAWRRGRQGRAEGESCACEGAGPPPLWPCRPVDVCATEGQRHRRRRHVDVDGDVLLLVLRRRRVSYGIAVEMRTRTRMQEDGGSGCEVRGHSQLISIVTGFIFIGHISQTQARTGGLEQRILLWPPITFALGLRSSVVPAVRGLPSTSVSARSCVDQGSLPPVRASLSSPDVARGPARAGAGNG
ncbi:hypothetical protein K438DRAFT_776696 [Mycena galopus ATCC 62051]|nr:hypothetical protein K438DRAFT_776696 [Mycena galopus ATCC 62051]